MGNPYDEIDPPSAGPAAQGDKIDRFLDRIVTLEHSAPDAQSPKGAVSRYQITKDTAHTYGLDYDRLKHDDAYAHESARKIATHLDQMFASNAPAMTASWNGGPGAGQTLLKAGGKVHDLPAETQLYLAHNTELDGGNPYDTLDPGEAKPADPKPKTPAAPPKYLANAPAGVQAAAGRVAGKLGSTEARGASGPLEQLWGNVKAGAAEGLPDLRQAAFDEPLSLKQFADIGNAGFKSVEGAAAQSFGRLMTSPTAGKPGTDPRQTDATRRAAGELVSALIPVPGGPEVRLPEQVIKDLTEKVGTSPIDRVVAEAAKSDPEHAAAAKRLVDDGVALSRWQVLGGKAKAAFERATSSPLWGDAVNDHLKRTMESFNTAYAQKTLRNIGVQLRDPKAGTDLVAKTRKAISSYYEAQLPRAQLVDDGQLEAAYHAAREQASRLPDGGQRVKDVDHIWNEQIKRFMKDGKMDGRTFKQREEELTLILGKYKNAQGDEGRYGEVLSGLRDALREGLERGSPSGVSANLKKANRAWAMYKNMERAAASRVGSRGVFTPTDLLGAIRKQAGGSSFAQGDGLTQQFATDAQRVVGDRYPDSGTAGRNAQNNFGRAAGAGIGATVGSHLGSPGTGAVIGEMAGGALGNVVSGTTNRVAGNMLKAHTQRLLSAGVKPGAPGVRNYLAEARGRLGRGVAPAVTARNALVGQGQQ